MSPCPLLGFRLGTAPPPPVTVYIRGPIKGYIYNHNIVIIQLSLRGGSTEGLGLNLITQLSHPCKALGSGCQGDINTDPAKGVLTGLSFKGLLSQASILV